MTDADPLPLRVLPGNSFIQRGSELREQAESEADGFSLFAFG
jgi:hypothetical protein